MATLGDMKARIADEIFRDDLGTAIGREIASAISFYQSKRNYFQERYDFTFNTVVGQAFYGAETAPELVNLISIDFVHATQNGSVTRLKYVSPAELDALAYPPSSGIPFAYTYYAAQLRIYPTPQEVLPIRVAGVIPTGMPQADDTPNSPWMNDAEELIRSRAKRNLYLHSLGDQQMAAAMKVAEDEAFLSLKGETASRAQIHAFRPDCI